MADTPVSFTTDIFGRNALQFNGSFAADSACISLSLDCGGCTVSGMLTQQLSVQYQQPITRLYEVGTQYTYYVAGHPQGTCNIARVVGPAPVYVCFYSCIGNVCNAGVNDLCFCFETGCGVQSSSGTPIAFAMKNVVLQSMGLAIQAQDMIINEQLSLMFTSLLAADANTAPGLECTCAPEAVTSCILTD